MKRITAILIILFIAGCLAPRPAQAQSTDVYALVDAVNALRAEYGLPAYTINASLMAAAQRHTEWAASVGYHSHAGPDGSRPRDRAIAAGYGGGGTVYVSENIYWGGSATISSAMIWWRNSAIHFQGMTSTFYQEIGAGIAYSGSGGYFTLLFGNQSGAGAAGNAPAAPASSAGSSGSSSGSGSVQPVAVATPGPDGAIVHQVQSGQAMAMIARAYGVDLAALLSSNGLTETSIIYPGDQIIIQPPFTPTPSPFPSLTPALTLTPAQLAVVGTPAGLVSEAQASSGVEELTPLVPPAEDRPEVSTSTRRWAYLGVGSVGLLGFALIFLGILQRRRESQSDKKWYEWE